MNDHQSVLSLDPSSTVIGWAIMASAARLTAGGLITPESRSAPYAQRLDDMLADLQQLLDEQEPATILIEVPTGKVHRRKRPFMRGMGLSVYGFGVGAVWGECRRWSADRPAKVVTVFENDWTRGVPKRDRQLAIAAMFDRYWVGDDPGADLADAIGLGVWWFRRENLFNHE